MTKRNANFWHWHPTSYPTKKGIHFSFTTMNFALRFMRKFKTWPFDHTCKIIWDGFKTIEHGSYWFVINVPNQTEPTKEQFRWLKLCKPNKKEKLMTFDEFTRGYEFKESKKDDKGRTTWSVSSKDFYKGRGYRATAIDKNTAIWQLNQNFNALRKRGDL